MALGELCRVGRGTYITGKQVIPGAIPVILGGMEPAYYHNVANHEGEAIVVSRSGVNAGYASFWDEPIFVSDGFVVDNPVAGVSLPYVFQALRAKQQEMIGMNRGSGVPHITGKMLANVSIPVPHLEVQRGIVRVLDEYAAAHEQLAEQLEVERETRERQLSLVRNQLLTFTEKAA